MKEKFKSFSEKLKTLWGGLTKVAKIVICSALGLFLVGAIVLTIYLNSSSEAEWIVLFPDMSQEESTEVYLELKNRGVETQINDAGEIEVRPEEWDALVFEMAELGYPQSAPSYGTFFDNLGMTMTEFEKQQALRFELQDRLQTTLKRIEGVKGAIVTINIPEESDYIWEQEDEKASASVTLTLENSAGFLPESVSAVKKLVAYSAQQMEPEDVTVINAQTGQEMLTAEQVAENRSDELDMEKKMEYANTFKSMYEANVEELLSGMFPKGVTAVAVVELDYDKIVEERKELLTDENGDSVKSHEEIDYNTDLGPVAEGGVVGEEQNSDIPNYEYKADEALDSSNTDDYHHSIDWIEPGYVLTQTEKANGVVKDASISVVVTTNTGYMSADERNMLVQLVKGATNINEDKIAVYAAGVDGELSGSEDQKDTSLAAKWGLDTKKFIILVVLCGFVVLAVVLIIIFMIVKSMRKKMQKQQEENDEAMAVLQEQIEENNRKSLEEAAEEHNKTEKAAEIEVREFAKNNPEVAAALIRSMLKERDE